MQVKPKSFAECVADDIADRRGFELIRLRVLSLMGIGHFDLVDLDAELGRLITLAETGSDEERAEQVGEIVAWAERGR